MSHPASVYNNLIPMMDEWIYVSRHMEVKYPLLKEANIRYNWLRNALEQGNIGSYSNIQYEFTAKGVHLSSGGNVDYRVEYERAKVHVGILLEMCKAQELIDTNES